MNLFIVQKGTEIHYAVSAHISALFSTNLPSPELALNSLFPILIPLDATSASSASSLSFALHPLPLSFESCWPWTEHQPIETRKLSIGARTFAKSNNIHPLTTPRARCSVSQGDSLWSDKKGTNVRQRGAPRKRVGRVCPFSFIDWLLFYLPSCGKWW